MSPLAERIAATMPRIAARSAGEYLKRKIRPLLSRAADEGRLAVGPYEIAKHVRINASTEGGDAFDLLGGRRNFSRSDALADLRMPNDGWIFFSAVLRPVDGALELIAYDVERFFGATTTPPWIRFDLNPPGHPNESLGLRSHLHPGNDDIQLPAPIMAPHELLELLLREPGSMRTRKPRTKGSVKNPDP